MTSSRELVILDSCFDLFEAEASVFGCGRTPTTRMDLAITSTRCGLRRRSCAAGSTTSGRPRGEGLGIPSPHLGCHGGNVDIISRPLYLPVNCSVSLRAYVCGFLGDDSRNCFRILTCSAVDTRLSSVYEVLGRRSQFLRAGGFLEMFSGLSPYSAQCLVRPWIQVASVYGEFHVFLRELVDYGS